MDLDQLGIPLVFALAVIFLGWYFVGAAITRRRMACAARWVNRELEPYRDPGSPDSKAWIKWLATNAFTILLEHARPPFQGIVATVLLRSRDMVTVWLTDRLTGRRDLLMLRCDLRRQPIWGVEIFRPRGILAGDARQQAREEEWSVEPSGTASLLVAHGGGRAAELCRALLDELEVDADRVVRLSVRRRAPHLTLAVDLPDPTNSEPGEVLGLAERLAAITLRYATR